jgi:DNA invertase Pin-like site-specific DNA recombinase
MVAVAYVRRSSGEESTVSREDQLEAVNRLAANRGEAIGHVYTDWGRSGASETRREYLAMLAAAEAGGVSAIYAYDQDRLARSNWLFAGLLRLADLHGFAVVTPAGDLVDEGHRDFAEMRGVMDGSEYRKIRRRNRGIAAMQRTRGDALGIAPYGHEFRTPKLNGTDRVVHELVAPEKIEHVIEAYRREGTYLGTARALNLEHWPSKHGRAWHATTVKDLVQREAPELVVGVTRGRRRERRPRAFAGLLRCRCGGPMSPGSGGGQPGYYCGRGERGLHARPYYVSESRLLPVIRAEADYLVTPDQVVVPADSYDDSGDRAALLALRGRVADSVIDAGLADLDARREASGARRVRAVAVPSIDWTWPPERLAPVLHALWTEVRLGPDMLPLADGYGWTVPEWRA